MKFARVLCFVPFLATTAAAPAHAAEDEAFTHALTLVQMFVRTAAQSDDPKAALKVLDDVLAGRNTEANRALAGLLEEATSDMSAEHKDKVASIGRDLAGMARKEVGRTPVESVSADRSLQARKDLTSMGLKYYDSAQFLDAVKRDDALAVELFLLGRGINVSAKGGDGRTALDIAKANKNDRLAALLGRNAP
jgi:Skp family chaperone for outer membrane proteins